MNVRQFSSKTKVRATCFTFQLTEFKIENLPENLEASCFSFVLFFPWIFEQAHLLQSQKLHKMTLKQYIKNTNKRSKFILSAASCKNIIQSVDHTLWIIFLRNPSTWWDNTQLQELITLKFNTPPNPTHNAQAS